MTIATASAPAASPPRVRRAAAVRAARAHSRLVAALRVLVPLVAAGVVAGFFLLIASDPRNAASSHEDARALNVTHGTITMEAPRLTGFNANGQTYEVRADHARQSTANPGQVGLNSLQARVEMRDHGWAHFAADHGHFDTEAQVLDLDGHVRVSTDKGDSGRLASARIELKGDRVSSQQPVEITLGTTKLRADSMDLSQGGNRVVFAGHVVMQLQPQAMARAPTHPATEDRK
jgi:lipopolysaccharide export system protein LptC